RGEQGPIADPSLATRETLGEVREAELRAAAAALGARSVECLDYPDGGLDWLADEAAAASDLERRIRRWQPQVVITFGPEGLYWHPDHIAVHRLTRAAIERIATDSGPTSTPRLYCGVLPEGRMGELAAATDAREL